MPYETDRTWSDSYATDCRMIIGYAATRAADHHSDTKLATDYIVEGRMVACRLRRPTYSARYGNQFTIRSYRETGTKTEFEKIRDGYGDQLLYGFVTADDQLGEWKLIDLSVFRSCLSNIDVECLLDYGYQDNGDGTGFHWFNVDSFPPNLVIATGRGLHVNN